MYLSCICKTRLLICNAISFSYCIGMQSLCCDVERLYVLDLVLLSDLVDVPCAMTTDDKSEVTEAQLYAVRLENMKFFCTYKTL